MANKKFTNPINRGRIVANKFEVTDVTGNEKIIKDITSNVNVKGTKLDAAFFTELQKGLVFTVDTVHSVESGVDIYTLSLDGLSGASNTDGFPLFPGLSLNIKIDISNTETASKIRISGSDYTFLTENGNTYTALNVGSLIKNNYYKIIFNGNEFILSDTTKATETTAGISKIATQTEVDAGIDDTKIVTAKKLKNVFSNGSNLATNGYQRLPNGLIFQWGWATIPPIPNGLGSSVETTINFPITFPTVCLVVNVSGTVDKGDDGIEALNSPIAREKTRTVIRSFRMVGSNDGNGGSVNWSAIGY